MILWISFSAIGSLLLSLSASWEFLRHETLIGRKINYLIRFLHLDSGSLRHKFLILFLQHLAMAD